jgi:hypothetical protein
MGAKLVIPLVVAADSHLIYDKLDFKLFSKSFALANKLRDIGSSFGDLTFQDTKISHSKQHSGKISCTELRSNQNQIPLDVMKRNYAREIAWDLDGR